MQGVCCDETVYGNSLPVSAKNTTLRVQWPAFLKKDGLSAGELSHIIAPIREYLHRAVGLRWHSDAEDNSIKPMVPAIRSPISSTFEHFIRFMRIESQNQIVTRWVTNLPHLKKVTQWVTNLWKYYSHHRRERLEQPSPPASHGRTTGH